MPSRSIDVLPWELLFNILSYLNLEDFMNLIMALKRLGEVLEDERINREMAKVCFCLFFGDLVISTRG